MSGTQELQGVNRLNTFGGVELAGAVARAPMGHGNVIPHPGALEYQVSRYKLRAV